MTNPEQATISTLQYAGTYNVEHVLNYIDSSPLWFGLAAFIAFAGAYMQYFGAVRQGFKDKSYSIAFTANMWFFAHDTTYVSKFDFWFHTIDHWTVKLFWLALAIFACLEAIVTYQILRFKRHELFPGLNWPQTLAVYGLCQLGMYLLLWTFHSLIIDPLYWISFFTTVILSSTWNIPLMLKRQSREGLSWTNLVGILFLTVGYYWWLWLIDPYFKQPLFTAVYVFNTALCLVILGIFKKMPTYQPQNTAAANTASRENRDTPSTQMSGSRSVNT